MRERESEEKEREREREREREIPVQLANPLRDQPLVDLRSAPQRVVPEARSRYPVTIPGHDTRSRYRSRYPGSHVTPVTLPRQAERRGGRMLRFAGPRKEREEERGSAWE